jgi:hypothetical protein
VNILHHIRSTAFVAMAALPMLFTIFGTTAPTEIGALFRSNHESAALGTNTANIRDSLSSAETGSPDRLMSGIPGPLLAALIGMPEEAMGWGGLARLFMLPGAGTPVLVGPGPILYSIEGGQVTISSDGAVRIVYAGATRAQEVRLYGDELTLGPGDQILIAAGVSHDLLASGMDEAIVLAASILPTTVSSDAGFTNAGLTPNLPLSVSMFLTGAGVAGNGAVWPEGVTVKSLVVEEITPSRH